MSYVSDNIILIFSLLIVGESEIQKLEKSGQKVAEF